MSEKEKEARRDFFQTAFEVYWEDGRVDKCRGVIQELNWHREYTVAEKLNRKLLRLVKGGRRAVV